MSSLFFVAAFCAASINFFDRPLALFWNSHLSQETEVFFKTIARLGEGTAWYVLGGIAFTGCWAASRLALTTAQTKRFVTHARTALFFLVAITASGVTVRLAKFLFGRHRPHDLFTEGLYGFQPFSTHWSTNSFPSGHSQTIWAVMTALLLLYPRYGTAYIMLAFLISLTRMLTSAHYFSDVVMGAYLGIAITIWIHKQFEKTKW